jgi:pimeloyl-ACP methyl ester carboxylesterase
MRRLAIAAALLLVSAATAGADPVIDRLASAAAKGRRLDLEIECTLDGPGVVTVEGTVNGIPVSIHKKLKAGHRTSKLKVDPKKLKMRRLETGLHFDVTVTIAENGGAETSQQITADIPLPCVVLAGFGNESTPGSMTAFTTALDVTAGGVYTTAGDHPTLVVHEYPSLTASLATLGKGLERRVRSTLKGTVFGKVDLVGYSYGGLVARSYMAQGGGPTVRRCAFLGTPNKGTPVAYLAVGLSATGQLDDYLASNPALADLATQLLSPDAQQALRNMYPTYEWAKMTNPLTQQLMTVPDYFLEQALGDSSTPLTALNAIAPPAGVTFDAFFYTSTGVDGMGTVDVVNVSPLLAGGQVDPAQIATGSGDGVVPAHSVWMEHVSAWSSVITQHDIGAGSHLTMPADVLNPAFLPVLADLLTQ